MTRQEMENAGATPAEIDGALELFELLKPGLKVKRNGRVDTSCGDKTPLGLYRIIARVYQKGGTK